MASAWRIVKVKHAATAFDGEGARIYGGRWNSVGIRLVYLSATKSLAALETLVHLTQPATTQFVAIPIEFNDALLEFCPFKNLPAGWNDEPSSPISKQIGDTWVKAARSAILGLPSLLTGETNYILNPAHPDFGKMIIGKPELFTFDPRLLT